MHKITYQNFQEGGGASAPPLARAHGRPCPDFISGISDVDYRIHAMQERVYQKPMRNVVELIET